MSIVENAIKKLGERAAVASGAPGSFRDAPRPKAPAPAPPTVTPNKRLQIAARLNVSDEYSVPTSAQRRLRDEVRRIKRAVLERIPAGSPAQPRELLVTSSVPTEGKTFMALNIAQSVAQERDCGVLLIDGDLARPRLSAEVGASDLPGLTDLLQDRSLNPFDLILETDVPGLWFLPAGPHVSQAPELVASARMREVLTQIHAADPSRVVLFDSPPLLASNEAQALAQLVQNILVIVRGQSTSPTVVTEALANIPEGKSVSLVLNRIFKPHGRALYGHYADA